MDPQNLEHIVLQQLKRKLDRISDSQNRAGSMGALIAVILGIGFSLVAQTSTKQYFHLIPLGLLVISFLLFYNVFVRNSPVDIIITGIKGAEAPKPYKKSFIENIVTFNAVFNKCTPKDPLHQIEKRIIWATATTQWAHAFFLTCVAMEIIESTASSAYPKTELAARVAHSLTALGILIIIRILGLYSIRYTNTASLKIENTPNDQ